MEAKCYEKLPKLSSRTFRRTIKYSKSLSRDFVKNILERSIYNVITKIKKPCNLRSSIKLQILLFCFHASITDVKGRSCSNINRISFE